MKTLFKIAIFSAALLITACNKTPVSNEPDNTSVPETDSRENFVGDYNLSINGDVNTVVNIPMLTINREGTYPVSYSDVQMRIEKMPTHPDSVVVTITIENETEETHGEVIGNKLLMQPMKMRMKISDITLTLTTDVEAEIANNYFSFSLDGTLNDKATKK